MHRAKAAVVLLMVLFFTPLHANVVAPTIYEQKDMGDVLLRQLTYSISVDCAAATISIIVMDDHNKPVEGAGTYLKYVDFSSPLIAQGKTDAEGFKLDKLPGSFMRGLFILVLEKSGFRNKEIHFDISGCYSNGTAPPKPPPAKPPANNTTVLPPANSSPPFNYTNPPANSTNQSGNVSGTPLETVTRACPLALLIPLLTVFKSVKR